MASYTLTPEIVEQLKEAFPGQQLFKKDLFGETYVFRTISRAEYKQILNWAQTNKGVKIPQMDEKFVERGLLFPQKSVPEMDAGVAGVIPVLSNLIQEKSALVAPQGDPGLFVDANLLQDKPALDRPDEAEIERCRGQAAGAGLHLLHVQGAWFVVRPIVRAEWNLIQAMPEHADGDIEICRKGALSPKGFDWEGAVAGLPTAVARHILDYSGFQDMGDAEIL